MIYTPQQYAIADEPMKPFIDEAEINELLENTQADAEQVRAIIRKSLAKNRLSLQETAVLINTTDPELIREIKEGARELKQKVYGKRIVLFAPLYIGNMCTNNCSYCGFRTSNKSAHRVTLETSELLSQVDALLTEGQKRLILVFGEHPKYSSTFIADSVRTVYDAKQPKANIRRVNINAAPLDIDGFREVKEAGIGTYQVFQETYHHESYAQVHPSGPKRDYDWRITALDRAQEAGIDDVGIGALLGLYDWRFEIMALIRHVNHFEAVYNVGPHTISFPRLQKASGMEISDKWMVNDADFTKLVAILRLAVPYTGLILTAREPSAIRDEILGFGVSQIDAGTNIQMKGYSEKKKEQDLDTEQFQINDDRSLEEVIGELIGKGFIPSFCTACYRLGRTGEHFMEFSVPGFIKRFCQPNAILTLKEFLEDYASPELKVKGELLIENELQQLEEPTLKEKITDKLQRIENGERDLYF